MYSQYGSASTITSYIDAFKNKNWPLIIGEFGPYDLYGNIDEDTIMSKAHSSGYRMLGRPWSGNSSDLSYLDRVKNFDGNKPTTWATESPERLDRTPRFRRHSPGCSRSHPA